MMLPGGSILTADIKNQRIRLIAKGRHHPAQVWGDPTRGYQDPPRSYGARTGRSPWATAGSWSAQPPGVAYPSDSNKIGHNRFLTVDYSTPGQIVIFNRQGKTLWRFAPTGKNALDHPSLALPLPNGDIVCNDDYNHRLIVVNPRTNKIVWQYGHTRGAGNKPGYLDNPDGIDLAPRIR